jgi:regulator of cell morphogenesis and NO signaling
MLDAKRTVRDFAIESPGATRVFEKLKIDYCCGGNQPLAEACAETGLDVETVLRELSETGANAKPGEHTVPQAGSATELARYIVVKHHVFTRQELTRLAALFEKVCAAHGANHPELGNLQSLFNSLAAELEPHMMKEERVLFPFIQQLEMAMRENRTPPWAPFGTVANPIRMMTLEHDAAGDLLRDMRKVSENYRVPSDACLSYQTLYLALKELEEDLHQHIHLENNILFPKAVALESQAAQPIAG